MSIFSAIIGFVLGIVGAVVQIALAILVSYAIVRIGWFLVSTVWKIIHEKSYDIVMAKLKAKFSKKKGLKKND